MTTSRMIIAASALVIAQFLRLLRDDFEKYARLVKELSIRAN